MNIKNFNLNNKTIFIALIILSLLTVGAFSLIYSNVSAGSKTEQKNNTLSQTGALQEKNINYSMVELSVSKLSCSSCIQTIKNSLQDIRGISDINVDIARANAKIYYDQKSIKNSQIIADRITNKAGYPARIIKLYSPEEIIKQNRINEEKSQYYIASVNGRDISRNDYDIEMKAIKTQYKNQYGDNVFNAVQGQNLEQNIKLQVLNNLTDENLILQTVEKADYTLSDKTIEKELADYLQKNSQTLEDLVSQSGYPRDYLKQKLANNILVNHYIQDIVFTGNISDNQKGAMYNLWFNNLKTLGSVRYYDTDLGKIITAANTSSGGCCPQK